MDGLSEDLAAVVARPNSAQSRDEVAANGGASRIVDLDSDRADLLRVPCRAVDRRADVIAFHDRAIRVDNADLLAYRETFFTVVAGTRDDIALGCGWSAYAVVVYANSVSRSSYYINTTNHDVADDNIIVGRPADRQSGHSVALAGRRPAHDVAHWDGPAHLALYVHGRMEGPVDLATDQTVAVTDDLHAVS